MKAIILNAGMSSRMKTYEPRATLKINEKMLIEHQYDSLIYHKFSVKTVVGFKGNKLVKKINHLPIEIDYNLQYEKTNNAQSLKIGFRPEYNNLLVINGDILFNKETLDVDYSKSFVIIDNKQQIKDREIGAVSSNNLLTNLSYGIKQKWCQIVFFTGEEFSLLHQVLYSTKVEKKLTFEIINQIIDMGGTFNTYENPSMKISEIDCVKELNNEKNKSIN